MAHDELHRGDLERELERQTVKITSPAFLEGGEIPTRFTCEGASISPPLSFGARPEGTRSLILVVDDPDAPDPAMPRDRFVHWVLYNLPPDLRELPEAVSAGRLPPGTCVGRNDLGRTGYGAPCPPIGRHRYFFIAYALDTVLPQRARLSRDEIMAAAVGHVIGQGELVGTYQKRHPRH
jgi:Raf kinase inhibitor-like YbhB/YbcL family protein